MGGSVTDTNQVQKAIGCFLSSTIEGFELIVGERVASALDVDDEEATFLLGFYLGPRCRARRSLCHVVLPLAPPTFHVRFHAFFEPEVPLKVIRRSSPLELLVLDGPDVDPACFRIAS